MSARPEDYEASDGYWIFDDKKLYLMDGSMMNRTWLIVTELMRRRKDLVDEFLKPYRDRMEKTLSIPQQIVDDADMEMGFNQMLDGLGLKSSDEE